MTNRPPLDGPVDPRERLSPETLTPSVMSGFPAVARQFARRDRAGLMLGGSIAMLLGAATLFAMSTSRTHVAPPVVQPKPVPAAPPAFVVPAAPTPLPVASAPSPVVKPLAPAPLPAPAPNAALAATAATDAARAPALVYDNGPVAASTSPAASTPAPSAPPAAKPAAQGLTAEEQFAQRLGGEGDGAIATRMASPATTVAQGTLMSAVLETALNSDLPGYVRAVISRDVKSFDGAHVLIPRGSHVIGQYKSGLAVGQTRAYILWTRLLRADGVSIALASPATDSAGRNGLGGKVDSHFGKRFGSAILLSVIGAAGQAIGGGNSAVVVAGPQQAVSASAQQNLAIPPTVRVNQGAPIKIFTARDLDFSGVTP